MDPRCIRAINAGMPINKAASLAKMEAYVGHVAPRLDRLLKFYMAIRFRRQQWRCRCPVQQTCMEDLRGRLADEKKAVVGFGN
ncbi:hypothetical protein H632_c1473p1 [Helicosporidium sp. ATCC 50920]|nr:hypothetical protein H632_c1473p1 [Helicosporidium sp. ATCC 50920]|eukprot:KDD74229.1 hypothetical protein H632_c1473p1 [Helicosporidium sp. ATCC 50920]